MGEYDDPLQRFIDDHHARLVGVLRFRGCSADDAEELAQEAMMRLVDNWSKVEVLDSPWGWLVRVALNLSRSRWRRVQTALRRRHLIALEAAHYDEPAVEALSLLDALTDRQRIAVVLRHYAGLSVREAADAMGVAEGTVKSLCAAGLAAARRTSATQTAPYPNPNRTTEVPS